MAKRKLQDERNRGFDPKLVGETIKRAREAQRISQRQLAASAGIAPQGLSTLEHGLVVPTITTLDAIARELHIETFDLVSAGFGDRTDVRFEPAVPDLAEVRSLCSKMSEGQLKLSIELLKVVLKSR